MEAQGFAIRVENVTNLTPIKQRHQVPPQLYSCHTAVVDGYIIEGHVSVAEIERLLTERPAIQGLAVPGMPLGSPGMEVPGAAPQPYDVYAFDSAGQFYVYASYPQE